MNKKIILAVALISLFAALGISQITPPEPITHNYEKPAPTIPTEYLLKADCNINEELQTIGIPIFAVNATDLNTTNREIKNHMIQLCDQCDTGSECIFDSVNSPYKPAALTKGLKWDYGNNNFYNAKDKPILTWDNNDNGIGN